LPTAAARGDARPPLPDVLPQSGSPADETSPCGKGQSALPVRHHPSHNSVHEPLGNQAVLLFVTVVTEHRQPLFRNPAAIDAVLRAWEAAQNWLVGRYVFMPDHIHFFCAPGAIPTPDFHQWMRYWKRLATQLMGAGGRPSSPAAMASSNTHSASFTGGRPSPAAAAARGDARPSKVWQDGCWDTQLRKGENYGEKWQYVRNNPVRKGLVNSPDDWPWQGEIHVLEWHE
jgi:REP element-mobilizing transposase RayT